MGLQSNKTTIVSLLNDSSLRDSSPQYPTLTGERIKLCERDELKLQFHFDFNWIRFPPPPITYLSYFKIIIPFFKILITQKWIFSDEIHHWITSLISFSWKSYTRPQKYIYIFIEFTATKLLSGYLVGVWWASSCRSRGEAQMCYKFFYNLQFLIRLFLFMWVDTFVKKNKWSV